MKTKLFLILAALLLSTQAEAKLAGKNVILVHGFQSGDLSAQPNASQSQANSVQYWRDFWNARAEGHLAWSSAQRVAGGIKDSIRSQIQAFDQSGLCAQGCVFVTHSTGDLVLRDALRRLGQWGINSNRFRVLAVLDLAGAGGGTGLADFAVNTANSNAPLSGLTRRIGSLALGIDFTESNLGVLNDLRVSAARNIATQNNVYPRLRFVGGGTQFAGITKGFLQGADDSVVALHSSCGARFADDDDSCSNSIRINGQIRSADGPSSLYFNHFPIIMGERVDHEEARNNSRPGGQLTTVVNNRSFGGINVDFSTTTGRKWWSWFRDVREVRNGTRQSFSATIFNTLNN